MARIVVSLEFEVDAPNEAETVHLVLHELDGFTRIIDEDDEPQHGIYDWWVSGVGNALDLHAPSVARGVED